MNPVKWYLERRRAKKEDREAIARVQQAEVRAGTGGGDARSQAEVVEEAFNQYPPQP